jgi:hypothetical protein
MSASITVSLEGASGVTIGSDGAVAYSGSSTTVANLKAVRGEQQASVLGRVVATGFAASMTAVKSAIAENETDIAANATNLTTLAGRVTDTESFVVSAGEDIVDHESRIGDLESAAPAGVTADAIATAVGSAVNASDGTAFIANLTAMHEAFLVAEYLAQAGYDDGTVIDLTAGSTPTFTTPDAMTVVMSGVDCTVADSGAGMGPVTGTASSLTSADAQIVATLLIPADSKCWFLVSASGLDETRYYSLMRVADDAVLQSGETRSGDFVITNTSGADAHLRIYSYADEENDTMTIEGVACYISP